MLTESLTNSFIRRLEGDEIVDMKEDAVPYIYEELKKGPTLLVHALDRIYPGKVQCEGYVPLTTVCNVWLNILR